jgi:hypothetical protein
VSKPLLTFLFFSLLVVLPSSQCSGDIFLLAFFRPAANKDYQCVSIFAEVNPVARTKINPVLINTGPNAFGVLEKLPCWMLLAQPPPGLPLLCSGDQTKRQTGCVRLGQGIRVLRP